MSEEHIFSHYRKEEQPFVERIIDYAQRVESRHEPILTDFVDPRQLSIIKNIVNSYMDLTIFFAGGYEDAERARALIVPDYWSPTEEDLGLSYFQIEGENKFHEIGHKDILGALMNIGLKREKFGDIIISANEKQIIVASEVEDFVRLELTSIGKTKISLQKIEKSDLFIPKASYSEQQLLVSSLRLDTVVSHAVNQSRSKVSSIIKANHVKVNWKIVDQSNYLLQLDDIVSVRGFGRFRILENEGSTKKGRIKLKISKLL